MGNVCHESASVPGMRSVLSHAIQKERPELFPQGSNTEQASVQDSFVFWFTLEIWYCSNADISNDHKSVWTKISAK